MNSKMVKTNSEQELRDAAHAACEALATLILTGVRDPATLERARTVAWRDVHRYFEAIYLSN